MRARRVAAFLVVTSLALLLSACQETVFTKLTEAEANEMIAALADAGLAAKKTPGEEGHWRLEVSRGDLAYAIDVLREQGLPHARYASIGDVFKKEGLLSTLSEERIRFIFAQQQELENTLSRIDGVVVARVHVVIPETDPLTGKVKPASASVFIKHRPEINLTPLIPQVKELVARGIEGLAHDSVSLSLFPATRVTTARSAASPAPRWAALPTLGGLQPQWLAAGLFAIAIAAMIGYLARRSRRGKDKQLAQALQTLRTHKQTRAHRPT